MTCINHIPVASFLLANTVLVHMFACFERILHEGDCLSIKSYCWASYYNRITPLHKLYYIQYVKRMVIMNYVLKIFSYHNNNFEIKIRDIEQLFCKLKFKFHVFGSDFYNILFPEYFWFITPQQIVSKINSIWACL